MCPQLNITVKLRRSLLRFYLFVRTRTKLRFLLRKENPLFEKRLSDKLTKFSKGSNLVSTFD